MHKHHETKSFRQRERERERERERIFVKKKNNKITKWVRNYFKVKQMIKND